jgi:hypothetical protein
LSANSAHEFGASAFDPAQEKGLFIIHIDATRRIAVASI